MPLRNEVVQTTSVWLDGHDSRCKEPTGRKSLPDGSVGNLESEYPVEDYLHYSPSTIM